MITSLTSLGNESMALVGPIWSLSEGCNIDKMFESDGSNMKGSLNKAVGLKGVISLSARLCEGSLGKGRPA